MSFKETMVTAFTENNRISPEYYSKYHVKRGLRNSDGTGVMAGVTNICNVHGYVVDDGEKEPAEGKLIFRGYNIKESLLWMRAGANMYKRRGGKAYAEAVKELFKYMRDTGFITKGQYFKCTTVRCAGALAPNWLRKFLYKTLLRKT